MGSTMTRREMLKTTALVTGAGILAGTQKENQRSGRGLKAVVVGAGAFGGWTALHLLRTGAAVTLIDAWGPGNARASSGGDSRVIRGIYGPNGIYVGLVARSFVLWRAHEKQWGRPLYHETGALWMFPGDDSYARSALPHLARAGLPVAQIEVAEARKRYPAVDFEGTRSVYVETEAGYLLARRACEAVVAGFIAEGGNYRQALVKPGKVVGGKLESLVLDDAESVTADTYVFACGPWLGGLFAELQPDLVRPTRQEIYYFGLPAGETPTAALPVWVDFGPRIYYGVPESERRGFKIADDTRGPGFDPTGGERLGDPAALERVRTYMARRFPAMKGAPLLEARVCPYENSPDGHYLLDRHPAAGNLWLLGGGSGHGFKLGPALGEMACAMVLGEREPEPFFSLARLKADAPTKTQMEQ